MNPFAYFRPDTIDAAVELASVTPDSAYVAGGTNLVDLMKAGITRPGVLIDITGLPLTGVGRDDHIVTIGGATRNSDLAADPHLRSRHASVVRATLSGASAQIRNVATVAGNLLQETRCPYFWDLAAPCHRRQPGSGCSARAGEHRSAAPLSSAEPCIATHPSDLAVALTEADADLSVYGPRGPRTIGLADIYSARASVGALRQGEVITAVTFPVQPSGWRSGYRKVRDRASFAFGLVSVAAGLQVIDGRISRARIAWGGIAAGPYRARHAELALVDVVPSESAFRAAVDLELQDVGDPPPGCAYKIPLIRRVTAMLLLDLAGHARS